MEIPWLEINNSKFLSPEKTAAGQVRVKISKLDGSYILRLAYFLINV